MATYVHIYIEVDLSEGLPKKITLNWNSTSWIQQLDYENTNFRCKSHQKTGHLQGSCLLAKPSQKRNPKPSKRWASLELNTEGEEEENGTVQNDGNKETTTEMNQAMKEDTRGKEPMQCVVNTQTVSGVEEHSEIA